jgi:hypothetical protein
MNKELEFLDEIKTIFSEQNNLEYSIAPIFYNKVREKEILHSLIIASLLEYSQKVNESRIFLRHFFNVIELKDKEIPDAINIQTEYYTKIGRPIDILITWDRCAIIIENKLNNAEDQPTQLSDYFNAIKSEGYDVLKVVYIPNTVTKHAPISEYSQKLKNKLIEIYPYELIKWFKKTIENGLSDEALIRETTNYINLLKYIEMENERFKENQRLSDELSKNNSILTAFKIHERWNDIRWHTEKEFWEEIETSLKDEMKTKILPFKKYNFESITGAVHKKRNVNYFYGLAFKIAETPDNNDLCLFIERGNENMYYGLMVKNNKDQWITDGNDFYDNARALFKDDDNLEQRPNWIANKYFEPKINFSSFNEKNTLLLKNKDFREKAIQKYIKAIKDFIKSSKNKLTKEINTIEFCI